MITVLWVMTVAGVMAAAGALSGRNTVNATRNRVHLERAFWIASGCASRAQAAIDATLRVANSYEAAAATWRVLDRAVLPAPLRTGEDCTVSLEAAGTRLDVNDASEEMLGNLFRAIGNDEKALGLAEAIADWRDSDDVALPLGAERDWYAGAKLDLPRNGPLADIRELSRVRGFDSLVGFDSLLSTDAGRVSLATASVTVLLSVPGFTRETAERIASLHAASTPLTDVLAILGQVSKPSADALLARYADVVLVTTTNPDAWILTVRSSVGDPAGTVVLQRRLVRAGKRAVPLQTRSSL